MNESDVRYLKCYRPLSGPYVAFFKTKAFKCYRKFMSSSSALDMLLGARVKRAERHTDLKSKPDGGARGRSVASICSPNFVSCSACRFTNFVITFAIGTSVV